MFASQKNILFLIENSKIKLCNKAFLKFFGIKNLKEFKLKFNFYKKIKFENLKNNLKNNEELFHYLTIRSNELFKLKLIDKDKIGKNFLLTMDRVPYGKDEYILSFIAIDTFLDENIFERDYSKDMVINLDSKDVNKFIENFKKIENIDEDLSFYNTYKGLTIFHKGKVLKVYDDKIKIEVDKLQLLAFTHEKKTFIHSKILQKDIQADINYINLEEEILIILILKRR